MGINCELLYDACIEHSCPAHMTCTRTPGLLEYECLCPAGSAGAGCAGVDECESSPCTDPRFECVDSPAGYTCRCQLGPGGEGCQAESSVCSSQPCLNNGTCVEAPGGFRCLCRPGFSGATCGDDIDECASGPCRNGAICRDRAGEYSCFCVPGFQGSNCEIDIDECASRPCRNHGTCLNHMDRYECRCAPGYAGVNCDTEIDECASDPCQNGALCNDHVGFYTCTCAPGYQGAQCEVDINECESQPCQSNGTCHDLINSYRCDCSDTGFEGAHCELDILECASDPCHNNATCLEGIKGYSCACWPGYTGQDCEEDVDECVTQPCHNAGLCLERSNPAHYGTQPLFPSNFSYSQAAGFLCQCQPGFTGETCFTNIDECESQPCQNGGLCQDLVNGFLCQCLPGYSGVECAVNINECEEGPCKNGAVCEDGIADYSCHCAPGQDGITWGGKNCSVQLTGCQTHDCQNEALCIPTYQAESHSHLCQCQPGFYDATCSTPTTFSFASRGYLLIELENSESRRGAGAASVSLRFRTTLPSAVLFYRGSEAEFLFLELLDGILRAELRRESVGYPLLLKGPRVDDGQWHKVEVVVHSTVQLKLWHGSCEAGLCLQSSPVPQGTALIPPAFLNLYIGGAEDPMANNTRSQQGFVGCLEDLQVDAEAVLPADLPLGESSPVTLGCDRTEWCLSQPCFHGGLCVDLWATFRCDCARPYGGPACSYEHPAATFGLENSTSFASFNLSDSLGADFNLSFFLRSRKPDGLLLQVCNGTGPCLTLYLRDGQLSIETSPTDTVTFPGNLVDGRRHLVALSFQGGSVGALQSDTFVELGQLPAQALGAGSEVFIGGHPNPDSAELWGGYFKGCLQDMQLNSHQIQFFQVENDSLPEELNRTQTGNLVNGCISDDTCKSEPCQNGGRCIVTWNDFHCSCPANFTGKFCEEKVWCESDPCPEATTCIDVVAGYVCLANATFNSHAAIEFTANTSVTRTLSSLHVDFRTRDEDAVLLRAVEEVDSLQVAIKNSSLLVDIRSGNSIEGVSFLSPQPVADGAWHSVSVSMEEPAALSSRWLLRLDGSANATLQGSAGNLDFLKKDALVVLAENFTGCLGRVQIGGIFLPFPAHQPYPQPEQFQRAGPGSVRLGCSGADVCASSPCLNAGTCEDLFNSFRCGCSAGWAGQRCEANIDDCQPSPCVHGDCVDAVADFQCECFRGFIGKRCDINVDDCVRHQCLNGATCIDGVYGYSCKCPPQYSGPRCEWPFPPQQCGKNFTCLNGGRCITESWGANCSCRPGFTGRNCQININECDPNPCQNGGTCQDSENRYECVCSASYTGERCDINKGTPGALFPSPLIEVAVPVACGSVLLLSIGLIFMVLTARKRRQSEGTYSPSQQEVAGARLEMDSVLKVPPEERLI
ncbi:protein crumbs homolog 2 isoform X3 [Poecile atricapillus]|nr:protein crumbs homolog 2 isoform X3 [Poecile atricapillus]XP_058709378.1 protein crumbs homolog 2 isoform X3 [Poecile atricapillus]XP_058709379.1 protein crumbs homolog 2 isoform X3 [Poecile atricapillus]XP_058709380.1 protein crumbs homolog 2 isoform X3 [Poecile atricapillus]XP_058709381.1 protein crumbs homolog 2 isoform X3 [Poecile atricapillus]XP_058709382.1 protein crumbs homolog 2 isoform X3 [Poecile atricapillus]